MENVQELHMPEQLCFTVQQAGGTETRTPVFFSKTEEVELDNGRSSANFKLRWEGSRLRHAIMFAFAFGFCSDGATFWR